MSICQQIKRGLTLRGHTRIRQGSREAAVFEKALREVMKDLATKLVEDGEGATKVVEIRVDGKLCLKDEL